MFSVSPRTILIVCLQRKHQGGWGQCNLTVSLGKLTRSLGFSAFRVIWTQGVRGTETLIHTLSSLDYACFSCQFLVPRMFIPGILQSCRLHHLGPGLAYRQCTNFVGPSGYRLVPFVWLRREDIFFILPRFQFLPASFALFSKGIIFLAFSFHSLIWADHLLCASNYN